VTRKQLTENGYSLHVSVKLVQT